jgi:K+-sensing histidine kinase KdpD
MGLGLSSVASLVWSVNGRCQLHNRTDTEGLLVELTLPLAPQTEEATTNGDE